MKNCPNCNSEIEDNFELCWNCNYSLTENKIVEFEDSSSPEKKKDIDCVFLFFYEIFYVSPVSPFFF